MSLSFCSQLFVELKSNILWLQSRYINQIHFRYISLKKLLERNISSKSNFDISRWSNYLSEIYQTNPFLIYQTIPLSIYLAQVITRVRYIKQSHFPYIIFFSFFDISCLSNFSSEIYRKWICLIYRDCSHDILDFSSTKSWEQNDRLITV